MMTATTPAITSAPPTIMGHVICSPYRSTPHTTPHTTVTALFVGAEVLAFAVGAVGGVLSMFDTVYVVVLDTFPAASRPRK